MGSRFDKFNTEEKLMIELGLTRVRVEDNPEFDNIRQKLLKEIGGIFS